MLHPIDPDYSIDFAGLKVLLKDIKLLGEALSDTHYAVGDNFLSQLTFMGCSPDIELEPHPHKAYCYIEIEDHEHRQFVAGVNLKKARCTFCKGEVKSVTAEATCSICQKTLELEKINWRKSAFVAKTWITIGNIYELEAIPNDALLDTLEKATGVKWKPVYIRQSNKITLS